MIGFEIFIGIFFVLACAAYWIFEREHAIRLVTSLLPRPRRKVVRDTWDLIDAKLGAYVRGQALLITLVATTLSLAFWAIGLPFWLLVGVFAGFVEIVPVIGPLRGRRGRSRRRVHRIGSARHRGRASSCSSSGCWRTTS